MNIYSINNSNKVNNYSSVCPNKNPNNFGCKNLYALKQDTISFTSNNGYIVKYDNMPKIQVLNGTSKEFSDNTIWLIKQFPQKWLEEFEKNNYKIVLSPTLKDAYESQGVYDEIVEFVEMQNPQGTLGATIDTSENDNKNNFFVFCDKPPYSNKYAKNVVNHELSHGIVNIKQLAQDKKMIGAIKKDFANIILNQKFSELSSEQTQLMYLYFFNNDAYKPLEELIADTHAWTLGAGCYGSGLVMDVYSPDLMLDFFPNLVQQLKQI